MLGAIRFARHLSTKAERPLFRLNEKNPFVAVPQAWVTKLNDVNAEFSEIIELHPDVFRVTPRLDFIHKNVVWQTNYKNLQLTKMLNKAEMPGGGRKPWPQKRMGRHHAGSIRSPHFSRGGFAHGVRGPRTWFYMLSDAERINGLTSTLTVKHAQDDLVVADTFDEIPSAEPQFLHDLAEERNWGYSVLFVAEDFETSSNLVDAVEQIPTFNVMPYFSINPYSMMKYETIVFTKDALLKLEDTLLKRLHSPKTLQTVYEYRKLKKTLLDESAHEEDPKYTPFV
ncbi:unnamed protein product [Bursaphelenchus okinawaensis]|uniref:Large ribosomal subunit protein uL4m n=1 Tax=Bursaphelenchus okinawaensis TaxID=465554 RepID=A0A811KEQ8_9BILA|nr:unnamed protein product [Bursaphelenchus okinawaensis]CAG9103303.1 unnamed protein product [Bursaphelenchus okinawaensis]